MFARRAAFVFVGVFALCAAQAQGEGPAVASAAGTKLADPTPAPQPTLEVDTAIEDATGHALDGFHAGLRRAASHQGQARIVFYGASHVASDLYTGLLREHLQRRFGDGGPGFVMPGEPWRYYRHAEIHFESTRGFRTLRIKEIDPRPEIYGLAGAALETRGKKPASASFSTRESGTSTGHADSLELYYFKQPRGGHLALVVDGGRAKRIATAGRAREPGYARMPLADGAHKVELRTEGDGPTRVFGVALERDAPGVILDTLGIPGTRARDHLYWEDHVYREHLARRQPDLVVLAYGTNEAGDDDVPIEDYARDLRKVVARVREVAPNASCLLIGPSDRPLKDPDGNWVDRPRTGLVIDAQRAVSRELGCGFFDVRAFMGGPLSMLRWIEATPPLGRGDHVHFTAGGYARLGEALYRALLSGYGESTGQGAKAQEAPRALK